MGTCMNNNPNVTGRHRQPESSNRTLRDQSDSRRLGREAERARLHISVICMPHIKKEMHKCRKKAWAESSAKPRLHTHTIKSIRPQNARLRVYPARCNPLPTQCTHSSTPLRSHASFFRAEVSRQDQSDHQDVGIDLLHGLKVQAAPSQLDQAQTSSGFVTWLPTPVSS